MRRLLLLILVLGFGFYVAWPAWSGYQIKSALDAGDAATLSDKIDFVSVRESLRPAARHHAERAMADALSQSGSPVATILDDETKAALLPKVVETTLNNVVTPENLIRIARHGGTIKEAVAKIVKEQMSGSLGGLAGLSNLGKVKIGGDDGSEGTELDIGGLVGGIVGAATGNKTSGLGDLIGGVTKSRQAERAPDPEPEPEPAPAKKTKKPKFGLDNIKTFGLAGPLGLQVGVAQDPKAKQPDITAEMGFRGMDWKLVALRPKF